MYVLNRILLGSFVLFAEPKILCEVGAEAKEDEDVAGLDCEHLTFFPELNETHAFIEDQRGAVAPTPCSSAQDCPDIRVVLQKLHPQEEVLFHRTRICWCVQTKSSGPNAQLVIRTIIII